jgi:hypothetical protein
LVQWAKDHRPPYAATPGVLEIEAAPADAVGELKEKRLLEGVPPLPLRCKVSALRQ